MMTSLSLGRAAPAALAPPDHPAQPRIRWQARQGAAALR